jgi:hypothetical protein
MAKCVETEFETTQAAAADDEDSGSVHCGSHLLADSSLHAVEEGDGERGAVARDDGEEVVDGQD